ncbi:MAG: DUF480 domain-containing protein [Desulfobacteraceae bacterium]|jgi:uncharacterized protein
MEIKLDAIEARIIGVLIEKQMATPDYYPLTLNALVNACNQKTNRDPVMALDEGDVEEALTRLRNRRLVWQVKTHGSRALKYEHNMKDVADFSDRELGVLCVLLLRGAQTAGELRSRTTRLAEFHGLAAVEHTLHKLINHEKGLFVHRIDRQPGQKEDRYSHLFCEIQAEPPIRGVDISETEPQTPPVRSEIAKVDRLENRVNNLNRELADLKARFEALERQIEQGQS